MKNLNLKKLHLFFCASILVSIVNAQCPNPVVCSSGMNGDIVSLKLGGVGGVKTVATFGYDAGISFDALGSTPNYIFKTTGVQRMTITSSGYVGIGTASPSNALEVVGNGLFSGSVSANGFVCNVAGGTSTYQKFVVNATSTNNYFDAALDASNTKLPIYFKWRGDQFSSSALTILGNGNIGVGCVSPTVKLAVNGKIQATEVEIKSAPCSDFVFEKNYKLTSLSDLEKYVTVNKHLPEVPSAKEFQEKGYSVGQMDDLLLRKVEELTLYVIELKKENDALKQEVKSLK